MKYEKSENLGPPNPFLHKKMNVWKKPPALLGLKDVNTIKKY